MSTNNAPLAMVLLTDDLQLEPLLRDYFAATQKMALYKRRSRAGAYHGEVKQFLNLLMDGFWIDTDGVAIPSLHLFSKIREFFNHTSLMYILSGSTMEPEIVRQAFRLGASDWVDVRDMDLDFDSALRRQHTRRRTQVAAARPRVLLVGSDHLRMHDIAKLRGFIPCGTVPPADALATIRDTSPQLVWLEADDLRGTESLIREIRAAHPDLTIFACLSDTGSGDAFRRLYRAGADDVFDSVFWKRDLPQAVKSFFPAKNIIRRILQRLIP